MALESVGCGSDGQSASSEQEPSDVCAVFDAIDWQSPPVTADDSVEEVTTKFDQDQHDDEALYDAATGSLQTTTRRVLESGEQYRRAFLDVWRAAGGGQQLSAVASEAGFYTSPQTVESLAFDDADAAADAQRELLSLLATECDGGWRAVGRGRLR